MGAEEEFDWWQLVSRGKEQPIVTFEDLRRMAHEGQLRRRDYVKRADKRKWKRAGMVSELWPAPAPPTAEDASPLTGCGVCGGQIAKEAQQCPKCGAPNRWLHPEIARFVGRLSKFRRSYDGFEVETRGYQLLGRSTRQKQFLDYAANAVGSLGFRGPLSLGGLASVLGASIGKQYAAQALRDAAGRGFHAFAFDFRRTPPTWSTTDDEFWEDVLDYFDVL